MKKTDEKNKHRSLLLAIVGSLIIGIVMWYIAFAVNDFYPAAGESLSLRFMQLIFGFIPTANVCNLTIVILSIVVPVTSLIILAVGTGGVKRKTWLIWMLLPTNWCLVISGFGAIALLVLIFSGFGKSKLGKYY